MTTKTADWFEERRRLRKIYGTTYLGNPTTQTITMKAIGEVKYSKAIINGKPARIRVWYP